MNGPIAPVAVGFNDTDEFLNELRQDRDHIDRRILRITVRRRYRQPFTGVWVVATATVEGILVKLERRVGESFAGDEATNGLATKTQTILDQLTEAGKSLGLDVRAGVYE